MPVSGVGGEDPSINYPPPLQLKDQHPNEYKILYFEIEGAASNILQNNMGSPLMIAANKALQAAALKYAEYPTKANRLAMIASATKFIADYNTLAGGGSSTNPGQDAQSIAQMKTAIAAAKTWTP